MKDRDNDPPENMIAVGNDIQSAIAKMLRDTYAQFLSEELPEDILALLKQFDERVRKDPGSKT